MFLWIALMQQQTDAFVPDRIDGDDMKQLTENISVVSVVAFAMILGIMVIATSMHENAHYQINVQHRVNSSIVFGPMMISGYVEPHLETTTDFENYQDAIAFHVMNEIIGYNVMVISISVIMGAFMVCVTYIIVQSDRGRK